MTDFPLPSLTGGLDLVDTRSANGIVTLPIAAPAIVGYLVTVSCSDGRRVCAVVPAAGDRIDELPPGCATQVTKTERPRFYCASPGQWIVME